MSSRNIVCGFFFCFFLTSQFQVAIAFENNRQGQDISASQYLENAREFYEQGQYEEAMEAVEQALKMDHSLADAYKLRAEILLQGKTEYDWTQAEQAAGKAVELQPENAQYHFTLGEALEKQLSYYEAVERFKRAVELDTAFVEACYHLGLLYRNEMYFYRGMVDVESRTQLYDENILNYLQEYSPGREILPRESFLVNGRMQEAPEQPLYRVIDYVRIIRQMQSMDFIHQISFDKYADDALEKAERYLQKAFKLDPAHWQSLLLLGLLAYEADDSESLNEYAEKLELLNIDDKDVYLFLGLAYNQLHDFQKAKLAFRQGLEYLSPEEKFIFESPQYLLPARGPDAQENEEIVEQASAMDNYMFWKARDPFYLTEDNERRLDHFARCAYVHFRFSFPWREIEGLKTDCGKVYIRYGEPLKVAREYPDLFSHHYYEIWYYTDRTFCFDDPWGDGRVGYQVSKFDFVDMIEAAQVEFEQTPEEYDYAPEGEIFDIPCQIASFRGSRNKTELEILYGIPITQNDMMKTAELYLASYNTGLFFFDQQWNDVLKETSIKRYSSVELVDSSQTDLMTDAVELRIEPGTYHFSLELENEFSKNKGVFRDTLEVDSYEGDELMLSDILLAMDIQPLQEPPQSRYDLEIFANPTSVYDLGKELHLYYEIYNLSSIDGNTKYSVSTEVSSVTLPKKGLDWVYSGIKDILGLNPREIVITTYYEYGGISDTELHRSILDVKRLGSGDFVLSILVKDLHTGQETNKHVGFRIREP
ncbi:tetratricopeptide repeat protein [bacterium]|nr:tetratricopeptide repeat protein [bacterium]